MEIFGPRLRKWFLLVVAFGTVAGVDMHAQQPKSEKQPTADQTDLRAIQELERQDAEAARTNDVDALVSLWTDDGVLLQPGSAPVIGKDAIRLVLEQQKHQAAQVETVAYQEDWKERHIVGKYAFEWGQMSVTLKLPNGQELTRAVNSVRVLACQPDGGWRIARAIVTPGPRP
jgi:uncharacterized protein (TIGR02246 family)